MICFRDMTFCTEQSCQCFENCSRALTNKVQAEADKWWEGCSGEAPISIFMDTPECFVEEEYE